MGSLRIASSKAANLTRWASSLVACLICVVQQVHGISRQVGNPRSSLASYTSNGELDLGKKFELGDLYALNASDGRCLKFLHIPKTAGTSVENQYEAWVQVDRDTSNSMVKGWGMKDNSLQCRHPYQFRYGPGCQFPSLPHSAKCSRWHTPPAWDDFVAQSYSDCTTFCIVRHPVQRFISEATYRGSPCTTQYLRRYARYAFGQLQSWPTYRDCHFLPQSEYVYGGLTVFDKYRMGKPGTYCQRVLRMENLELDFEKLMKEFNLPLKLMMHEMNSSCNASVDEQTRALIKKHYEADSANFNYEF